MKLSKDEVKHMALLARLGLSEDDIEKFQHQLSDILENFEILNQVDTANLPPTAQSISLENVFRPDEPHPSLPVNEVLANAPDEEDNSFKIKAVLE